MSRKLPHNPVHEYEALRFLNDTQIRDERGLPKMTLSSPVIAKRLGVSPQYVSQKLMRRLLEAGLVEDVDKEDHKKRRHGYKITHLGLDHLAMYDKNTYARIMGEA